MLHFTPKLLWVDLEMSGLDPRQNRILEFACILTDGKVTQELEGPHLIIHCDQEHLATMDEWNTTYSLPDSGTTPSPACTRAASTAPSASNRPNSTFWSGWLAWGW